MYAVWHLISTQRRHNWPASLEFTLFALLHPKSPLGSWFLKSHLTKFKCAFKRLDVESVSHLAFPQGKNCFSFCWQDGVLPTHHIKEQLGTFYFLFFISMTHWGPNVSHTLNGLKCGNSYKQVHSLGMLDLNTISAFINHQKNIQKVW